jgi:hypothetical protein
MPQWVRLATLRGFEPGAERRRNTLLFFDPHAGMASFG